MTENATEATEAAQTKGVGEPVAAPEDAPAKVATGYKVYDRTVGQFVGDTRSGSSRPSPADAAEAVPAGHVAAWVRV